MKEEALALMKFIRYKCDKCNEGYMKYADSVEYSHPILHKCDRCGHEELFDQFYPHVGAYIRDLTEEELNKQPQPNKFP